MEVNVVDVDEENFEDMRFQGTSQKKKPANDVDVARDGSGTNTM